MKTVVITGSTRGIGFGLAAEFLKHDCNVAVNGRSSKVQSIKAVQGISGPLPTRSGVGPARRYE